ARGPVEERPRATPRVRAEAPWARPSRRGAAPRRYRGALRAHRRAPLWRRDLLEPGVLPPAVPGVRALPDANPKPLHERGRGAPGGVQRAKRVEPRGRAPPARQGPAMTIDRARRTLSALGVDDDPSGAFAAAYLAAEGPWIASEDPSTGAFLGRVRGVSRA